MEPPVRATAPDDPTAPADRAGLAEEVGGALDSLDETDVGAHPEVFEALGARLRAELERLEGL
jgi:hypothetical protein